MINNLFYISAFFKHCLKAKNTKGFGIHSPSLFCIVSLFQNNNIRYYAWDNIEIQQNKLLPDKKIKTRLVDSLKKIFQLIIYQERRFKHPISILELGSTYGITTAYLAITSPQNKITTIENNEHLCQTAQTTWRNLSLHNITLINKPINIALSHLISQKTTFDLIVINAQYNNNDLWNLWTQIKKLINPHSTIILHNIHNDPYAEQTWDIIKKDKDTITSLDYFYFGIVFFDKTYIKKHYRLLIW